MKGDQLRDLNVKAGNKFELNVGFDGSPPPTVTWKRDEKEVKPSDHVEITNEDEHSSLKVKESVRADSGVYEMTLTNDSGTCKAKCKVNVLGSYNKQINKQTRTKELNEDFSFNFNY